MTNRTHDLQPRGLAFRPFRAFVATLATSTLAACALEAPQGPTRFIANANELALADRGVDLGACQNLQVPTGSKLVFRAFASGVQIYRWNGTSWTFDGPSALLFADAAGNSVVGTHYSGPTWESNSGSKVVGSVLQRCTPDPSAIAWLLLGTVPDDGPGLFHRVSYIQRVNTVGGNAPSTPGTSIGEEARVPYTTDYLFFRSR
jgi:hypothetical protein